MIEPTESEDKEELDRFCDSLICEIHILISKYISHQKIHPSHIESWINFISIPDDIMYGKGGQIQLEAATINPYVIFDCSVLNNNLGVLSRIW